MIRPAVARSTTSEQQRSWSMASESKRPKRKYGENWAKLQNSQSDISKVYEKLLGRQPISDLPRSDQDQSAEKEEIETQDKLTPGTVTPGTESPMGQSVPEDNLSTAPAIQQEIINPADKMSPGSNL